MSGAIALLWFASSAALDIEIRAGSIEHPSLPAPLRNVKLSCALTGTVNAPNCTQGQVSAQLGEHRLGATFDASQSGAGEIGLDGKSRIDQLSFSDPTGRYATENLDADLQFEVLSNDSRTTAEIRLSVPSGQAYVEPIFADFSQAPASLHASLVLIDQDITVELHALHQEGLVEANGDLHLSHGQLQSGRLEARLPGLAAANETYLQPFVLGTAWEAIEASGSGTLTLELDGTRPESVSLQLENSNLALGDQARLDGVDADLHWAADADATASRIRWESARVSKLPLEGASAELQLHPRGLRLVRPLRIGVASGALKIHRLSLRDAGQEDMRAELDAEIEPIQLSELSRALGWPEFSGELSGRLPGLRLANNELRLEGALEARAFDGRIKVSALRVLDPLGRVPRVVSDITLRNLDLAALTGAFSFGRIEGRLDGNVEDLRLRQWRPVAFRARIATPEDDDSRHRISQRAIDSISSIGGGPTGLLSRGVMRFFDDFAYDRIGWSCVLEDGVCFMDGLEPTADGGYVLVRGRWLPRIDVVGYSRRVDWATFVQQVRQAISTSGDISVR